MERYDVCVWGIPVVFILGAIRTIELRDEGTERNTEHVPQYFNAVKCKKDRT